MICDDKVAKAKVLLGEADEGVATGGLHKVSDRGMITRFLMAGGHATWCIFFVSLRWPLCRARAWWVQGSYDIIVKMKDDGPVIVHAFFFFCLLEGWQ